VGDDNLLAQIEAIALYYMPALLNIISLINLTSVYDQDLNLRLAEYGLHLVIVFIRCGVIAYFVKQVNSSQCK
jgi:hypothetical protein